MNGSIKKTSIQVDQFLRTHILDMKSYTPILPFEVLSEKLKLPQNEIIKLDANENPYGPVKGLKNILGSLPYPHIYPDPESRDLRMAISNNYGIPVQNILAGSGADELIDLVMRALLDPGDAIINCPPTFGMYQFDAAVNNARVVSIPRGGNFKINIQEIIEAVAIHQPKVLFLANPNNPDGGILSPGEIEKLLSLPLVVVMDEAYVDFAQPGTSLLSDSTYRVFERDNLIVLRTFSKWAGLAGLRVGFGIFPDWLIHHLWKIKQPYNVSVAASTAAIYSLENWAELDNSTQKIIKERERIIQAIKGIPWLSLYPSQANFILCKVSGFNADKLTTDLAQKGIFIRYFNKPGLQDHIRISVGLPEQMDRLIENLELYNG